MSTTRLELGDADPMYRAILEEATRAVFAEGDDAKACPDCGDREHRAGVPLPRMPIDLPPDQWTWLPGPCVLIYCGRCPRGRRPLLHIYHPTHARQEADRPSRMIGGHR